MLAKLKNLFGDSNALLNANAETSVWTNRFKELSPYSIGEWTYGRPAVRDWKQNTKLIIGKYCSIAEQTTIFLGGEHRINWLSTFPFAELLTSNSEVSLTGCSKGNVIIGHDVWIGFRATILSGVTVGSGAVIGAGSVVSKTVEPYSIVAGNPAKHIRFRLPVENIAEMLRIAWWDWPHERVLSAAPLLCSDKMDEFLSKYGLSTPR
jgi:acetyltransferase-like isoleucine patch superfamily enzyme